MKKGSWSGVKGVIQRTPIVRNLARIAYALFGSARFAGSADYWKRRYASGGDSGYGSYGELAEFKAQVINSVVRKYDIQSVIEFGCGDGNQLLLSQYPQYLGFDVSSDAISSCQRLFRKDATKSFRLVEEYDGEHAELALSLDVIYHLVEDQVFNEHIWRLFQSADRFVIIYSSNRDQNARIRTPHVRHRAFSKWVEDNLEDWTLEEHIPNRLPYRGDFEDGSFADFWVYRKNFEGSRS